jgi:putative FmdB family regulatory protein
MPVYEFYCSDCHTIFNFFSRRINTEKSPSCPKCNRLKLERKVSLFTISRGRKDDNSDGLPNLNEAQMEQAFQSLAGEMETVDEKNPRAMAHMIRKLYDATGVKLGPGIEEAIRRIETGGDPEQIEAEMGDLLEEEASFASLGKGSLKNIRCRLLPPRVDETFYEL